ncbi:MAG: hypothetical protein QG553_756 [Patescibacteria group bacterium]|nr:hypothetical protein [Patescibacteria group bacterium]
MFKLDDNLLHELGLGSLPPSEKNNMLNHIYQTLEMRVGMTLAQQMSEDQLKEFETFIDGNDEAGALKWLETNFPNYKQVVAQELDKLKAEIKAAAPQILASVQQQLAQMPQPPQPMAAPQPQPYQQPPVAPQAPAYPQPQMPPAPAPVPPANDQNGAPQY